MFFSAFILVSVDGEHHRLEKGVDFRHGHKTTQVGNMPGFGLKEEEEVSIFLGSFIVREEPLLEIGSILEMTCNFVLLGRPISNSQSCISSRTYLL